MSLGRSSFALYCLVLLFVAPIALGNCGPIFSDTSFTQDVTFGGNCSFILGSNVVLDGQGHTLVGDSTGMGIAAVNVENITVRNFVIENTTYGVAFMYSGNVLVENVTVVNYRHGAEMGEGSGIVSMYSNNITAINNSVLTHGNSTFGVGFLGSGSSVIRDNSIAVFGNSSVGILPYNNSAEDLIAHNTVFVNASGTSGIQVSESSLVTVLNNTVLIDGSLSRGLSFSSSSNNTVRQNNVTLLATYSMGIHLYLTPETIIEHNTFLGLNNSAGISLEDDSNHVLINNNTVFVSGENISFTEGIKFHSRVVYTNITNNAITTTGDANAIAIRSFSNNTLISGNTINVGGGSALHLVDSSGNMIVDQTLGKYDFISSGFLYRETGVGEIHFLDHTMNVGSETFSSDIQITNNNVFVNVSNGQNLNTSANVTFYNVANLGLHSPAPFTNGALCPASICTTLSTTPDYVFNVTHFSGYSLGNSMQDIDRDGIDDAVDPVVGNESHVTFSGLAHSLSLSLGGSGVNGQHTGIKPLEFRDGGALILNFSHNFSSSALNLSRVSIHCTTNSMIVNMSGQLAGTKTLYMPDNGFTSLCVKDAPLSTIAEISASCTGVNEISFNDCLGNSGGVTRNGVTCTDLGSVLRVENLSHSGIRGTGGASISGATVLQEGASTSFTESTAGSDNSQGANVTEMNFSTTASTTKWQGYFGRVAGELRMGSGNNVLYDFGSLPVSQIYAVFASTDNNFDFSSITAAAVGDVDTIWGFAAGDADSGTNVFSDATGIVSDVASVPLANLTAYTSGGVLSTSIYQSGVLTDGGTIGAGEYGSVAFGVNVDEAERDFSNNTVVDYELILPVNGSGVSNVQTYYFFMDVA